MNESWIDSVRFSLAAILAASLFGIATLSPPIVRNENFKQLCYEKQHELIALEAENNRRELFAQRIENSPELMEQFSRPKTARTEIDAVEQSIDLPESLAIHPDQMLVASDRPEENEARKQSSFSQTYFIGLARQVADSSTIQRRLLIASLLFLLLGIIPASWFHWRFFRRQLETVTTHVLSRYRSHNAHEKISSPHWDHSESKGNPPRKHSLHRDASSKSQ